MDRHMNSCHFLPSPCTSCEKWLANAKEYSKHWTEEHQTIRFVLVEQFHPVLSILLQGERKRKDLSLACTVESEFKTKFNQLYIFFVASVGPIAEDTVIGLMDECDLYNRPWSSTCFDVFLLQENKSEILNSRQVSLLRSCRKKSTCFFPFLFLQCRYLMLTSNSRDQTSQNCMQYHVS